MVAPPPFDKEDSTTLDFDHIFHQWLNLQGSTTALQAQTVQVRSGRFVGAGDAENLREEVLQAMDRLHLLWCLSNPDFDTEYPAIHALPKRSRVPASMFPRAIAAIKRVNEEQIIQRDVGRYFLHLPLSRNIGRNQANYKTDILLLQNALHSLGYMPDAAYTTEHMIVETLTSATVPDMLIPQTLTTLIKLRVAITGGTLGWAPFYPDEEEFGGDRFGGQTYSYGDYTIFVPQAARAESNKIHLFFSAEEVTGDSGFNTILACGLRGASSSSEWITIGVPSTEGRSHTISATGISDCLASISRLPTITSLRLSAQGPGANNLLQALSRRQLNPSQIEQVFILDTNHLGLARTLKSCGIAANRVTAYVVTAGPFPLPGSRNILLPTNSLKAICYSRLIQSARALHPSLQVPPDIDHQLLPLPMRGSFTTATPVNRQQVNLIDFCRRNDQAINTILSQEDHPETGCRSFIEENDIARLGKGITPETYAHHFFPAEIIHEIFV